jgi:hypothetical protein
VLIETRTPARRRRRDAPPLKNKPSGRCWRSGTRRGEFRVRRAARPLSRPRLPAPHGRYDLPRGVRSRRAPPPGRSIRRRGPSASGPPRRLCGKASAKRGPVRPAAASLPSIESGRRSFSLGRRAGTCSPPPARRKSALSPIRRSFSHDVRTPARWLEPPSSCPYIGLGGPLQNSVAVTDVR